MRLRRLLALSCLSLLVLLAPSLSSAAPAQEAQTPEVQQPSTPQADKPAEAETPKAPLSDRLRISAGTAQFILRGHSRGTTEFRDPLGPRHLQQTLAMGFSSSTGVALKADASYTILPRWSVGADILSSSPGSADMKDQRLINDPDPSIVGDFTLAEFASEHDPTYFEWSLGGAFTAFPNKKHEGSRLTIDAIMNYRKAHTEYQFDPGVLVANPFDPNAFAPSALDPYAPHELSSYNMGFETLSGGVRMSGKITDRFTVTGVFEWIWFGRFEGYANLGSHGTVLVHQPFGHFQPVFHTPGCNNDSDPNTPRCLGLLDADVTTTNLTMVQRSSRARGLRLDMDLDVRMTDWFGIVVGYHRQDFRSIGGTEKRMYGDVLPDPTQVLRPVENGELGNASVVTQAFVLAGRFLLF